jgi:UDP-glucose 4-epimerase
VPGPRVLVTGVASPWGAALARRLAADGDVAHVVGLDDRPVPDDLGGAGGRVEVLRADLRSPRLGAVVAATGADVVVHDDLLQFAEPGRPARALHDHNVVGTLQLLAALEALPRLRALVVRGSAAVYGSEPADPAFFTEDLAGRTPPRTRFQRDVAELEHLVDGFARRHPHVVTTLLRLQPVVGAGLDTPVSRLVRLPVVPTVLGFDPRVQLLDAEDAVGALARAVRHPVRGAVNVAAPDVVSLSRLLRLLGRRSLPVAAPLYAQAVGLEHRLAGRPPLPPEALRFLQFGRGVSTARMAGELGYRARFTTVGALERVLGRTALGAAEAAA